MFDERPIGDLIANQIGGGTPSRQVPSYWNGPIPWASVKDFTNGDSVISSTQESITVQGLSASASNLIPAGTPLICTRMAVGRSAIAPMDVAINQDVKALQPEVNTSRDYLLRLLQFVRPRAEAAAVGSTVKGIRIQDFLSILTPIAPAVEQSCIAEILTTLDTTIRQTEALIEKLKQVKQGLLHNLLTRGIDANGKLRPPQSQAPHLYKDSPLGWIPIDWNVSNVASEFSITSGITIGPDRVPRSNPRKYLRVANVQRARLDLSVVTELEASSAEMELRQLALGDLLVVEGHASTEEIGRCAMADESVCGFTFQNHLFRLRATKLDATFCLHWMNSNYVRAYWRNEAATSSGLNTINRSKLDRVLVAVPTHAEQRLIVAGINTAGQRLEREAMYLGKLKAQKSGLTDDLITGRVRVTLLLDSTGA